VLHVPLLFLALLVPPPEPPEEMFKHANEAFRRTEFELAIDLYRNLLNPPLLPPAKIQQTRMRLAESLFFTQHQDEAKREVSALLRINPNAKTDASVPPDFAEFFASAKRDLLANAAKKKVPTAKPEPTVVVTQSPPPQAPSPAPIVAVPVAVAPAPASQATALAPKQGMERQPMWHAAPWYLKIIPFGGGQLANHDPVGGGVFLGLEVAFLATNIVTTLMNDKERATYGGFRHSQPYPALYDVQLGSAIALYATLAVGLVDAFVWSPGRGERRAHVSVAPTADGRGAAAALSASF